MTDPKHEQGAKVRREVLGDDYVNHTDETESAFTSEFQHLSTRYAWGEIWARPGLDRKTRSAVTLTSVSCFTKSGSGVSVVLLGLHVETYRQLFNAVRPDQSLAGRRPLDVHLEEINNPQTTKVKPARNTSTFMKQDIRPQARWSMAR
jgi:alkylhydroperoxidase/carboxymuconolactone decarboxylase family protein YurZ